MKKKDVVKHFGSATNVAKALGIAPSSVSEWGEDIPDLRAFQIERITNGKLKVTEQVFKKAS